MINDRHVAWRQSLVTAVSLAAQVPRTCHYVGQPLDNNIQWNRFGCGVAVVDLWISLFTDVLEFMHALTVICSPYFLNLVTAGSCVQPFYWGGIRDPARGYPVGFLNLGLSVASFSKLGRDTIRSPCILIYHLFIINGSQWVADVLQDNACAGGTTRDIQGSANNMISEQAVVGQHTTVLSGRPLVSILVNPPIIFCIW